MAGNSPDLWKIAKVKEKGEKSAKPKKSEKSKELPDVREQTASDVAEQSPKPDMIYRNGKAVAVVQQPEKKSLNWLDRQEAAVWTSMSQSDTPSVWSAAMETTADDHEKARAFRVAEERPAGTGTTNSATTDANAEKSPEAKNASVFPAIVPASVSSTQPSSQPEKKEAADQEDGLMNKIFSFFGKNENPDATPAIGAGNPVNEKKEQVVASPVIPFETQPKPVVPPPASQLFSKAKTEDKQIVPTELRLTFKPNSTEMSVQSIKWIKALGQKAKKDIQNAVEVRMSNIDPALQNKRFSIIRSTLLGVGMEEVQIIPVTTDRTPHTIVLRMIVLPEEGYTEYTSKNNGIQERLYYKQW